MKKNIVLMRKAFIYFTVFLLLITSCSCGVAKTRVLVLEVGNSRYSDELKRTYDIESKPIVSINNQKIGDKKSVIFNNKEYSLEYKDTITYVIGGVCVDEYVTICNDDQGKVLILPDGEIYAMLVPSVGQIEIESTADELTVRQTVEEYLKEELDFSSFKYCDVTCSLPDISDGFGLYSFVWYNKIGDIGTDQTLNLCVKQDGKISALWMKYRGQNSFADISDSISIDDFTNKIRDKLNDIYGDELIKYSIISTVLTHYDGKPYIDSTIDVNYSHKKTEDFSEACRLLIPIE